jgi:hypothetical protein
MMTAVGIVGPHFRARSSFPDCGGNGHFAQAPRSTALFERCEAVCLTPHNVGHFSVNLAARMAPCVIPDHACCDDGHDD